MRNTAPHPASPPGPATSSSRPVHVPSRPAPPRPGPLRPTGRSRTALDAEREVRRLMQTLREGDGPGPGPGARHRRLGALLDGVPAAAALSDVQGRSVYRNLALRRIMEERRASQEMAARIRAAAAALGTLAAPGSGGDACRLSQRFTVAGQEHELHAVFLGRPPGLERDSVMVWVLEPVPPVDPDGLAERFGLTRREAEVALLLRQRRTNREIARTLFISPHTARRHTERVLAKLGVSSRREVGRALETPEGDVR